MTRRHLPPLVAALVALAGCGSSGPVIYVWVDVSGQPAVRGVTKLEVTVRQGGESVTKTFGDGTAPFALPTSFTVTPNAHLGTLTVVGTASDATSAAVAAGTVEVDVAAGEHPHAPLVLLPLDFQVNTTIAGAQIVTDYGGGRGGRQVAAASDGSLVTVYENISNLGRYDGLGRLFDGDGAPRQNAVSHDTNDFVINQGGTESVFFVSVAATPGGGFLAFWADLAGVGVMNARAFDATGLPAAEVSVSAGDGLQLGGGQAAAFGDGSWVVVWSQERASGQPQEIRARLLDQTGQPRHNATSNDTLDFPVGGVTGHAMVLPAVAVGPDQAFVIAWLDVDPAGGGALHSQRFSGAGQALGAEQVVAQIGLDPAEGPNLAACPDGYLVAYSDQGTSPSDSDVLVRFLDKNGLPSQAGYRVNSSTDGAQYEPAIAVSADGATLVVWTDNQARAEDGDAGSIRGRALHPFGLPIGTDFAINTTTPKAQFYPSAAAAAHGAFMVTWQDESGLPPDVDQSGIRGRLLYPDYAPGDGGVGAACGAQAPCQAELECVSRPPAGSFCHVSCTEALLGQPCPYGGVCTSATVASTSGPVCLFR